MEEACIRPVEDCVDGHVHFRTDQLAAHESNIQVDRQTNDILDVHLGFLQVRHVYDVSFVIPDEIGPEPVFDPLENLHVKIKEIKSSDDGLGLHLIVEFNAQKEKLMKEKITLHSKNEPQKVLSLIFHARVLGKFKGTPSLRNGIHCVRIEPEDEEGSDWQGF